MTTQMQLKVLLGRKSHGRRNFKKEKTTTKSCLFRRYIFMFTLTWITKNKSLSELLKTKETNFVKGKTWKFKAAVRK